MKAELKDVPKEMKKDYDLGKDLAETKGKSMAGRLELWLDIMRAKQ